MDDGANATASGKVKSYLERIERLHEGQREITDDIAAVYAELKADGFDPKVMKALVAERAKDPAARAEAASLLDVYREASQS